MSKRIIAVAGATGKQGGSVVEYLLRDGDFVVRGITRDSESRQAKALAARGVEVVQANFDDIDSVKKAFKNVYGVFAVTNFWDPAVGAEGEIRQGKNLVDAAKTENVQHFVWSTLLNTDNPPVKHAATKAATDVYLKSSGLPRTSLYTWFFNENWIHLFPLTRGEDSTLQAHWPILASDGPLGACTAADIGVYVTKAFKSPEEWIDRDMFMYLEIYTPRQVVKLIEEESGQKINLQEVTMEQFSSCEHVPAVHELWSNMEYFYRVNGNPIPDATEAGKAICPKPTTIRQWVKANINALIPSS